MRRLLLSVLALVAAAAGMSAGRYSELERRLMGVPPEAAARLLRQELDDDPDLQELLRGLPKTDAELRAIVRLRAAGERATNPGNEWTRIAAERKRSNPLYIDNDKDKETSNWLGKAYQRLLEAIERWLRRERNLPGVAPSVPAFGQWLSVIAWIILGLLLAGLLYLAIRHFSWKATLKRKGALLDDEEPERTLDEWLALADDHERHGRFREAVRCLYLACLMKFDEYRVARFDRGQTNWEHLGRIQQSPSKPANLDFTPPTKLFDTVWYGLKTEGKPDVDRLRAWYREIEAALRGARP